MTDVEESVLVLVSLISNFQWQQLINHVNQDIDILEARVQNTTQAEDLARLLVELRNKRKQMLAERQQERS